MRCTQRVRAVFVVVAVLAHAACASGGDPASRTAPTESAAVREGALLPALEAEDLKTRAVVTPASLKGRVVLLDFWASWCAPCKESIPFYQQLAARHAARGLTVIGVSVDDTRDLAERFVTETQPAFAMWWDDGQRAAARLQLSTMPTAFLIDRRGIVRRIHVGFVDADRAVLEAAIEALLTQP